MRPMYRLFALLLGATFTVGLFYVFGFLAIIACSALVLAFLLFSSEAEDATTEATRNACAAKAPAGFQSTTSMGAF